MEFGHPKKIVKVDQVYSHSLNAHQLVSNPSISQNKSKLTPTQAKEEKIFPLTCYKFRPWGEIFKILLGKSFKLKLYSICFEIPIHHFYLVY